MDTTLKEKLKGNKHFTFRKTKNSQALAEFFAANQTPLPTKQVLQIFNDIFCALNSLHQMNVVHQAISSDNILISKDKLGNIKATLSHFNLALDLNTPFKIHDSKTHAMAINYYESPQVFWGHINPMNQQIHEITNGKMNFFTPPLKHAYFSSQSGNHAIRKSFIDYGMNVTQWHRQQTLFLLTPHTSNDIWAVGVLLAESLTGVHPPLLSLETALNHDIHNQYDIQFVPLVEKLLALDKEERISAQDALTLLHEIKQHFSKKAS